MEKVKSVLCAENIHGFEENVIRVVQRKDKGVSCVWGFLDSLGGFLGKMAAMSQEIQGYKSEYECMSDSDLKREYNSLRNRSGTEYRNRLTAVKMVLQDRGYFQKLN